MIILASDKTAGASVWQAALAGTTASLMYGFGINLVRHHLSGYPPARWRPRTWPTGAVLLAPLAVYNWPQHPITARSWISAVLLGVLCTGIAFVFYYRLIARIGGPRTSTVTYLIPLFGVIWAWLLLGEPLTLTMALAGALILGGCRTQPEARGQEVGYVTGDAPCATAPVLPRAAERP